MAGKLRAAALKETRLILRDKEALAILFLMPVLFVVIMSLALQDTFRQREGIGLELTLVDADRGAVAAALVEQLMATNAFRVAPIVVDRDYPVVEQRVRREVHDGLRRFALLVPPEVSTRLQRQLSVVDPAKLIAPADSQQIRLTLLADPTVRPDHVALAKAVIERIAQGVEVRTMIGQVGGDPAREALDTAMRSSPKPVNLSFLSVATDVAAGSSPSSAQQNVPAYTLLSIFLLVVPLSGAFIRERDQGSLTRLASMPVPATVIFGGKLLPYFVLNQIQMALLLIVVGHYVLPVFGIEPLKIAGSAGAVVLMSCASSVAAVGFGLLIAMFARSVEQATGFGAAAVLILAAIGGIMVPKMMMPVPMQTLASWSPLGVALDGFLDIFVRGAGLQAIAPHATFLVLFAAVCLIVAMIRFNRLSRER